MSPADHAKAILAELRKAADQLGCGLRTLPFAETDDGIVVQVKARPRKERKEAKATASSRGSGERVGRSTKLAKHEAAPEGAASMLSR